MRDGKPSRQDHHEAPKDAPYFGLGFALQDAIAHSRRMVLRRARGEDGRTDVRRNVDQRS